MKRINNNIAKRSSVLYDVCRACSVKIKLYKKVIAAVGFKCS